MDQENTGQVEMNTLETDTQIQDNAQINVDEVPQQEDNQEQPQDQQQPFSVDDLDFEGTYKVGEYDLSKYKEIIPESNLGQLEEYAKKYQEKGFTQEQIEYLIDNMLEDRNQQFNREEVEKELNRSLTVEEKRNYKAVGSQLKSALEADGLGQYYQEAMANPIVFKIINSVLKTKGGVSVGVNTQREVRTQGMTGYQAVEEFNKYLRKNLGDTDIPKKQKELLSKLRNDEDINYFKEVLGL
ncbi:hypothetical protein IX317_000361 [Fusobacterium sp. DD29]|uniref:hypothetical protein n=1 Tax=unclassified Fusobacterium TaxID=2648384 RepID=UPI001B8D3B89|nr:MULTISPECIES: hypothetical protein [unclassified Fusobacterium]MBR8748702.1 hypothetical protein [Fusobacterium sp. DD29]MBR8760946.1 hypothetical protein [Fusobacterium sp. DD25]MBR8766981.1 hypothetical protein [Fusobacterium sp. DD43]MBR8770982.1 hypothetical protein [Fusobacterium sp. DD40]MBR8775257.1 hypothetical protein [Fusobacterium sp. DD17]